MKTVYDVDEEMRTAFLKYADSLETTSWVFPNRFRKIMETNIGVVSALSWSGKDEEGLERRNPLVVIAGDSVTAGHFELSKHGLKCMSPEYAIIHSNSKISNEITDVQESYPERFRRKLIAEYEATSVNVVNAGIAGDTIIGLGERLERDVISLQPDLAVVNCSLNWNETLRTTGDFYDETLNVVQRIKTHTKAEVILMTPNIIAGDKLEQLTGQKNTLDDRVEMIRRISDEEKVCLADAYRVWKGFAAQGYDVTRLLANGFNHPTVTGHEVFAMELMKLFLRQEKSLEWKEGVLPVYPFDMRSSTCIDK